jgi:hypothetical protein
LNLSASIVASAAIMGILVATTYQPLMNVRLLLIGNIKLWHITAVILILDLMQFRLDNTGGHISHLAGAFLVFFYSITAKGIDLSEIVTGVISFFNLVNKSSVTPFKKVHKNYGKPAEKRLLRLLQRQGSATDR